MRQSRVIFLFPWRPAPSAQISLGEVSSAQAAGRLGPGHLVLAHSQAEAEHQLVREQVMTRGHILADDAPLPPPVRLELALTRTGVTQLLAELHCSHKIDCRGAGESESLEVTTINVLWHNLPIFHFLEYN